MPKRIPVDLEVVRLAYEETRNATLAAEKLGIHRNTVYQVLRRFRGKCRDCSADIQVGEIYCPACKTLHAERTKRKRAAAKRAGICVVCTKQRSPISRLYCEECRVKGLETAQKNYYERKSTRGTPNPGKSSETRRIVDIRSNYGEDAVRLWQETGAQCQVCDRNNDEISIQIHHIDCNEKNHVYENLICLCFDCHQAVHKVLRLRKPKALLKWMKSAYAGTLNI